MTLLLLFLSFTVLFAPLVDRLWRPAWHRLVFRGDSPEGRLRLLSLWMASGLVLAMGLSGLLLGMIMMAPRTAPFLPSVLVTCLGHGFDHGPGVFTLVFLFASFLALGLVTVALFYPLPSFPRGRRRPGLERVLEELGCPVTVEAVPHGVPGCWSEASPRPRVVLLGEIEALLGEEELTAVLCHEAGHLARGDHRSRLWVRAYRRLLFFFRGAQVIYDAFVHELERRADDYVTERRPELRSALRRALLVLTTLDPDPDPGVATLGALGREAWSVKQRLARLSGEDEELPSTPPMAFLSVLFLLTLLLLSASPPGACTLHCLIDSLP